MGVNTALNMNLPWGTESEDLQLNIKSLIKLRLTKEERVPLRIETGGHMAHQTLKAVRHKFLMWKLTNLNYILPTKCMHKIEVFP